MPLYEYRCHDCGTSFKALRAMRDADAPIACPECGGEHTERQLSLFFSRVSRQGARAGSEAVSTTSGSSASACSTCSASSCASCSVR